MGAKNRDIGSEIVFLTRSLKAPTLREAVGRLAERARSESWTYEEFLAACLQREVSARESHGGEGRIRAARFPARKSLEEFDFDHARSLRRETIAHLGTLDFIVARDNVVFLGPPGTGKTHCETASTVPTGTDVRIGPAGRGMTRMTHWLAWGDASLWICLHLPAGTGPGPSHVGLIRSLSASRRDSSLSCHAVSSSRTGHRRGTAPGRSVPWACWQGRSITSSGSTRTATRIRGAAPPLVRGRSRRPTAILRRQLRLQW